MTADDRYDVSGLLEAQCEPGSNGLVLKNLVGITSKDVMDEAEARALEQATDVLTWPLPLHPSEGARSASRRKTRLPIPALRFPQSPS
jgi:hypothetical protein